jgi:hypothetical protein
MITLSVPTINDRLKDFDVLFSLWRQTQENGIEVAFDFSQCNRLRQNGVAFLGGLANLIESRGGKVEFKWDTLKKDVRKNLGRHGFIHRFAGGKPKKEGHSIPYREDKKQEKDDLVEYLRKHWIGKDWVHISELAQEAIVGTVLEIYANAFDHGKSEVGIFSCGQHYARGKELKLTVVDFGVGIPSNVRLYLRDENYPASEAIKWAVKPGNSTKPRTEAPGGVGLGLLKDFVQLNNGHLEIFSHEGYLFIGSGRETYSKREVFFEGTLVNIKLICDDKYYMLSSEKPTEQISF